MPPEAQQARLRKLTLRAVERGLAEGRAGALAAALRLLGLAPARPPRTPAEEPAPEPPPPSGERWGLLPDGDGGWLTPDGRPAMPGRDVSVIAAPGGPVRLVDIFPEEVDDAQLEFLEGLSLPEVAELNYAGRVCGYGEQWDPRSRTLWLYGEIPAPRVARGEGRDRPPDDAIWAPPPADEDADWAWQAAKPVPPPAAGPAPPPPTPEQLLGARLEPLLAKGFPDTPEETDLADAVCALRRRGWPRYAGPLDILGARARPRRPAGARRPPAEQARGLRRAEAPPQPRPATTDAARRQAGAAAPGPSCARARARRPLAAVRPVLPRPRCADRAFLGPPPGTAGAARSGARGGRHKSRGDRHLRRHGCWRHGGQAPRRSRHPGADRRRRARGRPRGCCRRPHPRPRPGDRQGGARPRALP